MRDTDADIESIVKQLSNEDTQPFADDVNPGKIPSKPKLPAITSMSPYGPQLNPQFEERLLNQPTARNLANNAKPTISPVEAVKFDLELLREAWSEYKA